jgi:hypothetical protein
MVGGSVSLTLRNRLEFSLSALTWNVARPGSLGKGRACLEVEKGGIQKSLESMGAELQAALARCDVSRVEAEVLREECERLRADLKAKSSIEEELQESEG